LAYTIYSFQEFYQDTGLLGIYLGTDSRQVAQAVELVLRELRKFRREKLSRSELAAAKSQLKGNLMLGLESTSNRMNRLARHELFLNEYVSLDDTIRAINKVKSRDVTLLAQRLLDEESLAAEVLGPNHDSLIEKIDWSLS
jgi:predicted Zn-dependent peptidase